MLGTSHYQNKSYAESYQLGVHESVQDHLLWLLDGDHDPSVDREIILQIVDEHGERDYLSSISSDDKSDSGDEISDAAASLAPGSTARSSRRSTARSLAAQRAALVRPADVHEQAALCRTKCSQRAVKNTEMRRPRASY